MSGRATLLPATPTSKGVGDDDGADDPDGLAASDHAKLAEALATGMDEADHHNFKAELQQEAVIRRRNAKMKAAAEAAPKQAGSAPKKKKPVKTRPRPKPRRHPSDPTPITPWQRSRRGRLT